jgi:hypothetical protein
MFSSCSDETTPNRPRLADRYRVTVVQHAQSRAIVAPPFGSGAPGYHDDGCQDVGSWLASALAERDHRPGPGSYGSFARRNHYGKLVWHLQRGEHEVRYGIPGGTVCGCGLIGQVEKGVGPGAPPRAGTTRKVIHLEAFWSSGCLVAPDPEGLVPFTPATPRRTPQPTPHPGSIPKSRRRRGLRCPRHMTVE